MLQSFPDQCRLFNRNRWRTTKSQRSPFNQLKITLDEQFTNRVILADYGGRPS